MRDKQSKQLAFRADDVFIARLDRVLEAATNDLAHEGLGLNRSQGIRWLLVRAMRTEEAKYGLTNE